MHEIDISQIDLNLLTSLDALLAERSVSRAARRLGVGQPAASHALARLRELLGDALLVRVGREMVPTPRGEALREPLARALSDVVRLLRHESRFEAQTSERGFRLICPDLLAPALPRLVEALHRHAPKTTLEILAGGPDEGAHLEAGAADVALGPTKREGPGLVTRGLGAIGFGIVARQGHPALSRATKLSARAWAAYAHIVVQTGNRSPSLVGQAVERAGLDRRIGVRVPSFLAALFVCAQTDLFFAAPRELVTPILDPLGLRCVRPPIDITDVPVAAHWHERFQDDPAHRFFRELVIESLESTLAPRRADTRSRCRVGDRPRRRALAARSTLRE